MLRLFLLIIFCLCIGCKNDVELLEFKAIDDNDDIIFLADTTFKNKIYAIDTNHNRKVYTYDFGNNDLDWPKFDSSVSRNIFFLLNSDEYFYILNPAAGKISKKEIDYPIADLTFIEKKVQIVRNIIAFKGRAVNCSLYNPVTDELEKFVIPEGRLSAPINVTMYFNDKAYLPISYDSSGSSEKCYPTVYNVTDNKIIDFFTECNYTFFHFVGQDYLFAYRNDDEPTDIYKINSFEPTDAHIIFSYDKIDNDPIGLRIFEDDDYLYVIDQPRDCQRITKCSKTDYNIVAQKVITAAYQAGAIPYYKNNCFWIVSREDEGAYKISKSLEISVVK